MATHDALGRALRECGKSLALALMHYQDARKAYEDALFSEADAKFTDASLYIQEDPVRLVFRIQGPIPTTNLELKHYLPRDRYVWGTLKAWWHGQIASAVQAAGRCPMLETAAVIVQIGSNADLDNLGLKCLIDALVRNGVMVSDRPQVLKCLVVEHIETEQPEIRVCLFEPDEAFRNALAVMRSNTTFSEEMAVTRAPFEKGDFFFQG